MIILEKAGLNVLKMPLHLSLFECPFNLIIKKMILYLIHKIKVKVKIKFILNLF